LRGQASIAVTDILDELVESLTEQSIVGGHHGPRSDNVAVIGGLESFAPGCFPLARRQIGAGGGDAPTTM
jgi:hypothetical protein